MEKMETVQPEDVTVEFMRTLKEQRNWSYNDIAETLGAVESTVKGWVTKKELPLWAKKSLANILNLEIEKEKNRILIEKEKETSIKIQGFKDLLFPTE